MRSADAIAVAREALRALEQTAAAIRGLLDAAQTEEPRAPKLPDLPHNMTRRQARELLSLETRVYDRIAREHGRRPGREWLVPTTRLLEAIDAARSASAQPATIEDEDAPLDFEGFRRTVQRRKAG